MEPVVSRETLTEEVSRVTVRGGEVQIGEKPKKQQAEINKSIGEGVLKFDDECIRKLKEGFAVGLNIKQACRYAGITTATYYNHVKRNPLLFDTFDAHRQDLGIKAKQVRATAIYANDLPTAERYIAKEEPDVLKLEHSGDVGDGTPVEDKAVVEEFHARLKANMRKRSRARAVADGEL